MEKSPETDLALLLQSHDQEDEDSAATEADHHLLTVYEILLNHSSPSSPSSPRDDDYFPRRQEQSQHRDPNVCTFNYSASGASGDSYRTKYIGGVLPHLLGGGLIKSNSKPGAALEAAAAASHAPRGGHQAMRANSGATRSVGSDTSAMASVSDELLLSQSFVTSGGTQNWSDAGNDQEGLGFSESQEAQEVGLEEHQSPELDSISEKASGQDVNEAEVLTNLKTLTEVGDMGEVPRIANEEEKCATLKFETLHAPPVENEKESVLDKVIEVTAEVFPSDITGEDDVTAHHLSIFVDINMPYVD